MNLDSLEITLPKTIKSPLREHIENCEWCSSNYLDWCQTGEFLFEESLQPLIPFGKYKGFTFSEVAKKDPSYLGWMAKAAREEEVRDDAKRALEK